MADLENESDQALPAEEPQVVAAAGMARVLADPQRMALFTFICENGRGGREVGCKELVARFPVSQATISHHLKELQSAGLVEGRREGQCLFLRPRGDALAGYIDYLATLAGYADTRGG